MPRAMLIRVKRLEAAVRSAPVAPVPDETRHDIMTRLAAHADLFREMAGIAAGAQSGAIDRGRAMPMLGQLAGKLAAREARA